MADAEGRPTDAHELNRQLADTIGAQVEQLLGMSGYSEVNNMNIDAAIQAAQRSAAGPGQPGAGGGSTPELPAAGGPPTATGSAPATATPAPTPAPVQEGEIDWES